MLDLARRRWPSIEDRRQLLLRLAGAGAERIAAEIDAVDAQARRERQREAMSRANELLDADLLLSDAAWR